MRRLLDITLCMSVTTAFLSLPATASVVTVSDVPSYIWYNGCGPTAAGMIIGYWDSRGFTNLIPGGDSWDTNLQAVQNMIASPGNIRDYAPTPDRVATLGDPYHTDNCVADFMQASRDSLAFGDSYDNMQGPALTGYMSYSGYSGSSAFEAFYGIVWSNLLTAINASRPAEFYVDSDADGAADHFVTVIGYDNTPGALKYEAYNTYDHVAHWYSFAAVAPGVSYGVKSATFFNPGYLPGDTNRDGVVNSLDIDAIYQHLTVAPPGYTNWPRTLLTWSPALAQYDVNGDGSVSQADVTYELNTYFLTSYGDADLNKASDFQDFQTLLNHWQATGAGVGWADGDFNGDGVVDFLDFQNLLNYWNPGGWNFAPAQAPEPVSLALLGLGGLAILRRNRRTSSGPRPGEKGDTRRNSSLERKLKRNLSSIPGNCRNVSASSNFVSGQFKSAFKGDVS